MKNYLLGIQVSRLISVATAGLLFFGGQAFSEVAPASDDRFLVDWGSMRVSFYGIAEPATKDEDFKNIERRARLEGMAVAKENVIKLYKSHMNKDGLPVGEEAAKAAAESVVTNPSSIRTEYFSDGRVKVHFENSLALALQPSAAEFSQREKLPMEGSMFSGLILRTEGHLTPKATYEIVDETGRVLYSQKDVSEEAFQQNLMGRWFKKANRQEIASAVGLKPISINFEVDPKGRLQVQGSVWQEAISNSPAILQNARVALIVP
jgi:hypothetical protein